MKQVKGEISAMSLAIKDGNRRDLAKAITLMESTRAEDKIDAESLLIALKKNNKVSKRIAISGTPGVGKSTFIEYFGMFLIGQGMSVAVLAIDPSSKRTGGSILGDKTRMPSLAREERAFIRPSPNAQTLGGVARTTRQSIKLLEAAGFDVILVETVGVGQSETVAADMTDMFILLMAPAGGDELQGVKRGIMEISDLLLVNKADGGLKSQALRTCADYSGALRLMKREKGQPEGFPKARTMSAIEQDGFQEVWNEITGYFIKLNADGQLQRERERQKLLWFEDSLLEELQLKLSNETVIVEQVNAYREMVKMGKISAEEASKRVISEIWPSITK